MGKKHKNITYTPGGFPLPKGFLPVERPPDYFRFNGNDQDSHPVDVPARLARQRLWPTITGGLSQLEDAIDRFEHIAEIIDVRLLWLAPGTGQAGSYSLGDRCIYLADELFENLPLYGWVLAHELGHALDPRFEMFGGIEYGHDELKTRDYELIAETVATRSFLSFGLTPHVCRHRENIAGKNWERRLNTREIGSRVRVAKDILKRPLPQETPKQRRAFRKDQRELKATIKWLDRRLKQDMAVHRFTENPFSRQRILDLWRY